MDAICWTSIQHQTGDATLSGKFDEKDLPAALSRSIYSPPLGQDLSPSRAKPRLVLRDGPFRDLALAPQKAPRSTASRARNFKEFQHFIHSPAPCVVFVEEERSIDGGRSFYSCFRELLLAERPAPDEMSTGPASSP